MADRVDTSEWQKRYEVIEEAYCQGRWGAVMENGTVLLRELIDAGGDPEVEALRHRMQLLMAHTLLHGYGDRDAAEDLYEVVRNSDAEPSLRQIAEDGLDLCHQPLPSSLAIEEDGEDASEGHAPPALFLPEPEGMDLEDGEEDDRARAASSRGRSRASQMPLQPVPTFRSEIPPEAEATPEIPPEAESDLGVATDPFGASLEGPLPLPDQELPVMPWLTESPAGQERERGVIDGGLGGRMPWAEQAIRETVTADVVEEPELIELHQATPSLAEEVDLLIKEEVIPDPPVSKSEEPKEDGDLRTGLLLVVVG